MRISWQILCLVLATAPLSAQELSEGTRFSTRIQYSNAWDDYQVAVQIDPGTPADKARKIIAAAVNTVVAENKLQIPYDAQVAVANAYVRGGPGTDYYATDLLEEGTPVEVYRQAPDGWLAIFQSSTCSSQ